MAERPIKVAIIGGGCASITAAWELSKPENAGRYEITVYQEGWRLGGKGASGRGVNGRIEEHGLHIWLGFYDNAFRMMRECHAELEAAGLGHVYGDWRDAWTPENDVALFSAAEGGGFEKWLAHMPPRPGLPGDPLPPGEVFNLAYYMARAFDLFRVLILDAQVDDRGLLDEFEGPDDLAARISRISRLATFATATALAEALTLLAVTCRSVPFATPALAQAAEAVCERLRGWLEERILANDDRRFLWEVAELALVTTVGLIRSGAMIDPLGLDPLDEYDCREFLRMNGASIRALQSPFLRGLFDLAMAYSAGDPEQPSLSAGQGIRGSLRTFFGYRGAFMWRMRAGMGDVVFAPLYTALKRRGVRFAFFHRLTNIGLANEPDKKGRDHVRTLTFDVQARAAKGDYDPLVDVRGRPCWPAEPDWDQLEKGAQLKAEHRDFESHWDRRCVDQPPPLTVGVDFDLVVLGVGLGAVPYVASEILAANPRWAKMCEAVKTVASQAFQVWLDADLDTLGWEGPAYITGAFAKPFDTWCDMAHVVPEEDWKEPPRTAVYFCAVLPDPPTPPSEDDRDYPHRRAAEVRANAEAFLEGPMREAWPGAFDSEGRFRWDVLSVRPNDRLEGAARFSAQYWRANVNPSDRYVIHVPGTTRYRISPLDMSYDNLTVAGDWTDSGFHSGCVEGAVMSGLLAANALSGAPKLEDIIAYDHP